MGMHFSLAFKTAWSTLFFIANHLSQTHQQTMQQPFMLLKQSRDTIISITQYVYHQQTIFVIQMKRTKLIQQKFDPRRGDTLNGRWHYRSRN